jgi:hypothetical protein
MSSEDSKEIDPSEFVQRIQRLGDQRDREDAERVKKLEEELIQGRSERLARRAGLFLCPLDLFTTDVFPKQNEPVQSPPTSHILPNRRALPPPPPEWYRKRLPARPHPP